MTEEELAQKRLVEFEAGEQRKRRITYTFLAVLFLVLGLGGGVTVIYLLRSGWTGKGVETLPQLILGSLFMLGAGVACAFKAIRGR